MMLLMVLRLGRLSGDAERLRPDQDHYRQDGSNNVAPGGAPRLIAHRHHQNQKRTPTTKLSFRTSSPRARARSAVSPNLLVHAIPM